MFKNEAGDYVAWIFAFMNNNDEVQGYFSSTLKR